MIHTIHTIRRLLIANRGEIAVRIIRACRERGIESVVVYADPDAGSIPVRLADHAVSLGGSSPAESYLQGERVIAAALSAGCDAVHPGFGFLSENADFAQRVRASGLIFVGPTAESIRAMGVKTAALERVRAAGVPTLPGFAGDSSSTTADFLRAAAGIGYPVLVKAAAGGGGKGMRIVHAEGDLPDALESAQREAGRAFGDARVFLEKYIEDARHIEIQLFADSAGNTVHLFERECSVQRRHQKIIEETPSPYLTPDLRSQMGEAAVNAARAIGYLNAGTVEFIVDARDGRFYFLEMNTRLQVEHPITELVTGIDLVHLQLRIAEGELLPFQQAEVMQRGHAIECRIYAEDPAQDFLPQTGTILRAVEPRAPGVRVDSGVGTGDEITIHYDPMIAKLIVHAETREAAIRRMDAALAEYVILGLTTNIPFLRDLLNHPVFLAGETTTNLIARHFNAWQPFSEPPPAEVIIAAALGEMFLGTAAAPTANAAVAEGDFYSPWVRTDGYRTGMGGAL
ncbi:MAG TPA: acetyl-CoA carboxylase biotin carboxylase subunit [Aggregatilineales bacterium]|nr:acetyl-CoA carboxylase biotin carboxylase subunit [Anaerolineales bacterium]HRE47938.1 acetyl-CoA carboxylase biotin carboxylase subunit [Aggregatilineales bacterium]